ncbi:MAG: hypothetical protein ACXWJK_18180 [Burkholderiaceae bacterium]
MSTVNTITTLASPEIESASQPSPPPPPFHMKQLAPHAKSADSQASSHARAASQEDDDDDIDADADDVADASDDDGDPLITVQDRMPQQDQAGHDRTAPPAVGDAASIAASQAAAEDMALSDELAKMTDSGIFELLLPDGASLGVAVDVRTSGVGFLLSPSSDNLRTQLQTQQMELEGSLKRRMGCNVKIAIL